MGYIDRRQSNRRRAKRAKCEIHASYQHMGASGPSPLVETTIMDISETGVRFRTNEFIPAHSRLLLKLDIPKRRCVELAVQTMWVREIPSTHQHEIGAHYETISAPDKSVIQQFTAEAGGEGEAEPA